MLSKKLWLTPSLAFVLTLAVGPACSLKSNMDEMHDDTHKMAGTTEGMAQKTNHMSDGMDTTVSIAGQTLEKVKETGHTANDTLEKVKETGHTANETFEKLRQSGAAGLRESALKRMNEMPAIESKIFQAGLYMKAFEFQLWDNTDPKSERFLQSFYQQAAQEFVRIVPNYLSSDPSVRPVSPSSTDNTRMNLYALAVSLQELNNNIVMSSESAGFTPLSMIELIKDTLRAKRQKEAHPELVSDWEHEISVNAGDMEYLFQIRMNFLAAMTLAKISKIREGGFWGIPGLFRKLKMVFSSWDPMISKLNTEQIKEYTRYLYGSNDARTFLAEIGVRPKMDSNLAKIFRDMNLNGILGKKFAHPANDAQLANNYRQEALKGFLDQLEILAGRKPFVKIPELDHPELHRRK